MNNLTTWEKGTVFALYRADEKRTFVWHLPQRKSINVAMRKRSWTIFLLGVALCSLGASSGRVAEGKSQLLERVQQGKCHAFCNEQHGLVKGWTGPDRNSMAEAQKDADAHNKQYHDGKGDVGVLCE